jgi:hypothetical protein
MSNSAYADQRVYGGDITDISNSPFTDERRQGGGGGSPSDGTGNVQYDISNQTLNTRLNEINTIIPDINQGASGFVIGNDVGSLNFDAIDGNIKITHGQNETGNISLDCEPTTGGNGNIFLETKTVGTTGAGNLNGNISGNILLNAQQAVSITSSLADATLQAGEIVRTNGLKGAVMQGGLDSSGNFENQINMTLDQFTATTEIKSEGDSGTNGVQITTRTDATQGCIIALNSTETPTVPDRIVNSVIGIPPFNPTLNNQAWYTVQGTSSSDNITRRMLFFEDKAEFQNFTTIAFSGGTVDPVFEFKANQYYQFINDPTGTGDVLTVTAGSGSETDPWGMEWLPSSGGGGDVSYNTVTSQLEDGTTPITQIALDGENFIRGQIVGNSETLQLQSVGPTNTHTISLSCNRTATAGSTFQLQDGASGFGASARFRIGNPTGTWFDIGGAVNTSPTSYSGAVFTGTQVQGTRACSFDQLDFVSFCGRSGLLPDQPQTSLVLNRFTGFNRVDEQAFYRFTNTPDPTATSSTYALKCTPVTGGGGQPAGGRTQPFQLVWTEETGGATSNANLVLNYDTSTSTLILSDPTDNLPVISTTQVVPGRTVLVEDVTVNGTTELSALGLSNSIFPPPLEGQAGYFDGLVGNSPPRVGLNPSTGLTNWFKGASFRATLSGEIVNIGGYDDIILRVYSNRGQASQNILNSFRMVTRSVSPPPKLGWKWVIDFTCRSVNDGGILGVLATSSQFDYSDDSYVIETLGAIVSNTNSSFDTSVTQYLDFTIEFDFYNQSNNIKTTIATIERIF